MLVQLLTGFGSEGTTARRDRSQRRGGGPATRATRPRPAVAEAAATRAPRAGAARIGGSRCCWTSCCWPRCSCRSPHCCSPRSRAACASRRVRAACRGWRLSTGVSAPVATTTATSAGERPTGKSADLAWLAEVPLVGSLQPEERPGEACRAPATRRPWAAARRQARRRGQAAAAPCACCLARWSLPARRTHRPHPVAPPGRWVTARTGETRRCVRWPVAAGRVTARAAAPHRRRGCSSTCAAASAGPCLRRQLTFAVAQWRHLPRQGRRAQTR